VDAIEVSMAIGAEAVRPMELGMIPSTEQGTGTFNESAAAWARAVGAVGLAQVVCPELVEGPGKQEL